LSFANIATTNRRVPVPQFQAQPGKAPPELINITLNWFDELKQRVPVQ
jgi:hypothetical protein